MGVALPYSTQFVPVPFGQGRTIGYACKTLALPEARMASLTAKTATPEHLGAVIRGNLEALDAVLEYCNEEGIRLFRISSDIIPFGSSPLNTLDWRGTFAPELAALGAKACAFNIRLSMHPGQYTVLNSPDTSVAERARADLTYHTAFLDSLNLGRSSKVIVHIGGAYGDKQAAARRFELRYGGLSEAIRARLVLENDDRLFTAPEVLAISRRCGAPMVFDVLHHELNCPPAPCPPREMIDEAHTTWTPADGNQKIHYSQQASEKRPGSHSDTIALDAFLDFAATLGPRRPDIMLEVKDKNISALKCLNALDPARGIMALERDWARYKYAVLERDPACYQEIRALLKDKGGYPALPFYRLIEQALRCPVATGPATCALEHVWGYLSDQAAPGERATFASLMQRFAEGGLPLARVKGFLFRLARDHRETYLLRSYFFDR